MAAPLGPYPAAEAPGGRGRALGFAVKRMSYLSAFSSDLWTRRDFDVKIGVFAPNGHFLALKMKNRVHPLESPP